MIKKNPDMTAEEFNSILKAQSSEYNFNTQIINRAKLYFYNYQERHQELKEFREKYPNDIELFRALFGENPAGKIEVSSDPISLQIGCSNFKDLAWISGNKNKKTSSEISIPKAAITGLTVGGLALEKGQHVPNEAPPTQVINKIMPFLEKRIKRHEGQHVWYDAVFLGTKTENESWYQIFIKKHMQEKLISYVKSESLSEEKLVELEGNFKEYLQEMLEFGCARMKNEILAYFADNSDRFDISFKLNSFFTKLNGSHNFLKEISNPKKEDPLYFWKKLKPETFENKKNEHTDNMQELRDSDLLISETVNRVKEEAKKTLEIYKNRTTNAIRAIHKIKSKSFSRDQVISLLTTASLQDFPKIAERV